MEFTVGQRGPERTLDGVSGTAAQSKKLFRHPCKRYSLAGEMHIANSAIFRFGSLWPVVQGMLSLHNFHSKPALRRSTRTMPVSLATDGSGEHFMTPAI